MKKKRKEYIERMKGVIIRDLNEDRDMQSIRFSLGLSEQEIINFMLENNLKDLYGEPTNKVENSGEQEETTL